MKKFLFTCSAVAALAVLSSAASLDLHYSVTPNAGLYDYTMTLSVDTSSSGFASGMGWSWIIFGDGNNGPSPLADFVLTSAPPAPFGMLSSSSGGHNGPTWLVDANFNIAYWCPATENDTISWTGTSANPGLAGTLQFSELLTKGDASVDNWKDMVLDPVPEPASLLVLGGLLPIALRRRRK